MAHPKKNISFVNPDAVMIDPKTGRLTRDGRIFAEGLNRVLERVGGVTGVALPIRNYTVATLPDATVYDYGLIFVTDEAGGATLAFSDGTNWRRVQDRVVVS